MLVWGEMSLFLSNEGLVNGLGPQLGVWWMAGEVWMGDLEGRTSAYTPFQVSTPPVPEWIHFSISLETSVRPSSPYLIVKSWNGWESFILLWFIRSFHFCIKFGKLFHFFRLLLTFRLLICRSKEGHVKNKPLKSRKFKGESVVAAILPSLMEVRYCTSGIFCS